MILNIDGECHEIFGSSRISNKFNQLMIYLMAIEDAEIVEQETENFVKLGRVFSVSMFNKNRIKS